MRADEAIQFDYADADPDTIRAAYRLVPNGQLMLDYYSLVVSAARLP